MTRPLRPLAGLACLAAVLSVTACSADPAPQVLGTKLEVPASATAPLVPGPDGALATRLTPATARVSVGQEVVLHLEYADGHGGLVGTVEDFGDDQPTLGALKLESCRSTEKNPPEGGKDYRRSWDRPGRYTVQVTVTTDSCAYGQEESVATAVVTVG